MSLNASGQMKMDKSWRPILVSRDEQEKLKREHSELVIVDQYKKNLEDLFLLRHPKYRFDKNYQADFEKFFSETTHGNPDEVGNWFYYPWLNTLIHFLADDMHQELRMGRNRNLITKEEQVSFYNSTIGILGMSVGSHVAIVLTMIGGAKHLRMADPDELSGDNLNRIRNGFQNVGTRKVVLVAQQIYELNPYAEIEIFENGLTEENLEEFLNGENGKLDVLVEEMDNPYLKLKVRYRARELAIPVVMAADNGDGNIVDIERFDLDQNYPILHGILGDTKPEDLKNITPKDLPKVIARMAGANFAVLRMLDSVAEVGKSLYSWPQLGTAANLCGTVLTYLVRRIILKAANIKSGRYLVSLDAIFESDYKRKWFSRKIGFLKFIKKMKKQN